MVINLKNKNMSLKILVCYYKDVIINPTNEAYFRIQCGADATGVDLLMTKDNTGDNISYRNTYWSEITGLYWAWKNIEKTDYVGLCSYRRFFNFKQNPKEPIKVFPLNSTQEIENIVIPDMNNIFNNYDVVLPKQYTYAYNTYTVCKMNYRMEDFEILENLINDISPEYKEAYKKVFYDTNLQIGHNMFIMKWNNFQEYCSWVFSILLEAEKKINPTDYPVHQIRVFGYMHEILLAVFIEKKRMKPYYSQLTWLTDNSAGFKFNKLWYRLAANLYFRLKKH